jgi:hypothetical protein
MSMAETLLAPTQRTAVAVEVEKNRSSLARRHVPDDHMLAVGGIDHHPSASGKPAAAGIVRRRSGKYWSKRCAT